MATGEKPTVLDYAPPPEAPARRFGRTAVYVVTFGWSGILVVAFAGVLIADAKGLSVVVAGLLTVGTAVVAALLLKTVGRAGCVTVFVLFSMVAVGVIWLAV